METLKKFAKGMQFGQGGQNWMTDVEWVCEKGVKKV